MKLQVVKTDKGYVAISDFKNISKGDRYYNLESKMFLDHDYEDLTSLTKNDVKIIATDTTFKLEEIPQFKLPNILDTRKEMFMVRNTQAGKEKRNTIDVQLFEDLEDAKQWCRDINSGIIPDHLSIMGEWYVPSQSKGYFTEEDIRNSIRLSYGQAKQSKLSVYDVEERIITSLKQPKKLVAIEVDMTMRKIGSQIVGGLKLGDYEEVINIIESEQYSDGLLTIKQYFYK